MMYYSILASFYLLGMASSQSIDMLTACVTKEQNLDMTCKFTPASLNVNATCTYEVDKKVVATTDKSINVESTFKNRGKAEISSNICKLSLTGFADDQPKTYTCTIKQEKSVTKEIIVEKNKLNACSAGNTLKHGGVILLLAFVLPLLSGML
ncbi:thy-1 membrane glycoprotein [Pangasianodon hypophthalmus]|uniref:thy-1 membrane glycoprotein n=1 Tax=Pangasianodon hypophthalmus TaxID=310915 RepID=UPI00230766FB|nr:thy-1 membrane glycoprotein [Pangasianodon hypophthalmus]